MRRAAALPGMAAGGRKTPREGGERDEEGETELPNSARNALEPSPELQPVHRNAAADTITSRREQQARAGLQREDISRERRRPESILEPQRILGRASRRCPARPRDRQ